MQIVILIDNLQHHHRGIPPDVWLRDYFTTYIGHDVTDLAAFSAFVRLAGGRTATEVNLSALAGDAGIRHNTARAWLSVLETSFLVTQVAAFRRNLRKRQIKAPKLHFLDSGLLCHLLGIRSPEELRHHPLRGQIFESWVVSEVFKRITHQGREPRLGHYRAPRIEVDLVVDRGLRLILAEAKSGTTMVPRFLAGLRGLAASLEEAGQGVDRRLVYGGDSRHRRNDTEVVPWNRMLEVEWD